MSQSLERVLVLMDELAAGPKRLGQLAVTLDIHKSTVLRTLQTLERHGWVRRDGDPPEFRLGLRLVELSNAVLAGLDVRSVARPSLQRLGALTGETAHLAVRDKSEMVYLDKVESVHPVRMYSRIGARAPLHCTGAGKVLLAFRRPTTCPTWSCAGTPTRPSPRPRTRGGVCRDPSSGLGMGRAGARGDGALHRRARVRRERRPGRRHQPVGAHEPAVDEAVEDARPAPAGRGRRDQQGPGRATRTSLTAPSPRHAVPPSATLLRRVLDPPRPLRSLPVSPTRAPNRDACATPAGHAERVTTVTDEPQAADDAVFFGGERPRAGRPLPGPGHGTEGHRRHLLHRPRSRVGRHRFYPYADERDALRDVLNLSKVMAYKAALAGLDLGGGKAVIIGDPAKIKSEALLRAYGRFVQSLGGRYYTACDVGTFSEDMDDIAGNATT